MSKSKFNIATCCHSDPDREHMHTPIALDTDRLVATDGHLLVSCFGAGGAETSDMRKPILDVAREWWAKPATHAVQFETIRSWALEAIMLESESIRCAKCGPRECENCGSWYVNQIKADCQHVGPSAFNRVLLRRAMAPFRGVSGPAAMWIGDGLDPLMVRTADVLVVLMPMRATFVEVGSDPFVDFETLAIEKVGAA